MRYQNRDGRNKNKESLVEFANQIQIPITTHEGNSLEVSKFVKYVDGTTPSGTSAFERRTVAVDVPVWIPENCIQCNQCAFVCPHAIIRPINYHKEKYINKRSCSSSFRLTLCEGLATSSPRPLPHNMC
jgi:pyruvate-ferredoxin/flavodoxin oxidoreductase